MDSIVSCGSFSRNRWPLRKGPLSYRRWRAFHAEPPAKVASTRARQAFGTLAGSSGRSWPVRTGPCDGDPKGILTTRNTREALKRAVGRMPSVREKIKRLPRAHVNAHLARRPTRKRGNRRGRRAPSQLFLADASLKTGMENSAPALMPEGQRAVTVLVRVQNLIDSGPCWLRSPKTERFQPPKPK